MDDTWVKYFSRSLIVSKSCTRCLTHVINLTTQSLIRTHTKSKHYNPAIPEEHVPNTVGHHRDEVGLILAIAVKYLNTFIYEIGLKEPNLEKHKKIGELELWENEWECITNFLNLLTHTDNAQQAFLSDRNPSLHLAIPALKGLHKAWSLRLAQPKYSHFKIPLRAAIEKIKGYYAKTSDSDAYIMAMLLDPNKKMNHFKKNWDENLQQEALENAERVFQEYYLRIHERSCTQNQGHLASAGT
ncbi:hypothetical protein C8R48DRAFT_674367 [Suillus tomentosus]|nr:hypothetical protein C8R48DRAFT_674367 [Suillus tomentosus]